MLHLVPERKIFRQIIDLQRCADLENAVRRAALLAASPEQLCNSFRSRRSFWRTGKTERIRSKDTNE